MYLYKINKEYDIICESKPTRVAFKHVAHLLVNGHEIDEVKICYINRTWERYTFESVISKLLYKNIKTLSISENKIKKLLDKFAHQ